MDTKVLIVDDEVELASMTCEYFQMFDVNTAYVTSGREALGFLEQNPVELILLDINLGDGSGFEVCKKVRENLQIPILFISARQSDDDVLAALSIGGDDYIKKPYSLAVLLAKVKVILKRMEQMKPSGIKDSGLSTDSKAGICDLNASTEKQSGIGGSDFSVQKQSGMNDVSTKSLGQEASLKLDEPTMSAIIQGRRIPLKAKEFALLKCLYEHRNTIVTKEILFEEVWGDVFFSDGTLNVHIRKLREKLEENPNQPKRIKTIWGTGYMLEDGMHP